MAVIPVWMGSAWTHHSDLIKNTSIFTQWLTSKSLVTWNFGTWELRANQDIWINYSSAAEKYLLPYGLSIFVMLGVFNVLGIINSPREKAEIRLFITSIIASIVVVFVTFLNLYQHEYYYIALSASTAIIAGYGIARFLQLKQHILTFIFTIWVIVFIIFNFKDIQKFHNVAVYNNQKAEQSIGWAHDVQQFVPPDKWVVVIEYGWNPSFVYPLQRKTMVVSPKELGKSKSLCQLLSDKRFALVVVGDLAYNQNEKLLKYTFKCFKSKEEVMPGVYLVTH
jgi:preprotein translocase subunit SecG